MALRLLGLLLLLAMTDPSSAATYCVCKDGLSDSVLQKNIDYACGNGADCTQINQGGSCYSPNTVKDHCNYAVNSYFQKKGQATGSCDFSGTAIPTSNPPIPSSGCVYPSSGSGGTPTTPSTGTPGIGTPGIGTPGMGTPGTGTPGMGTPGTGTPGTGTPGTGMPGTGTPGTPGTGTGTPGTGTGTPSTTIPGGSTNSPFPGLGPTGGINNPDGSGSLHQSTNLFYSLITLLFSGLMFLRA